jgi:hypothetical protein
MAVVLPLLLLLGIGCMDVGRAIAAWSGLGNATRIGGDWAATHRFTSFTRPTWESQIRSEVQNQMQQVPGFDAASFEFVIEPETMPDGSVRVRLTSSQTYHPLIDWPVLPTGFTLHRSLDVCQYQ